MNDIKSITAKNISTLRQKAGMTQLELAEKLNYSDKAISKWEHGDSLPDITVLAELADLFGVSLDLLVRGEDPAPMQPTVTAPRYRKDVITLGSLLLVVFVSLLTYILIHMISGNALRPWIVFVYAVPVCCIVWLVLNSLWFRPRRNYLIISLLMWSGLASVQLSLHLAGIEAGLVYLLGIPGQLLILLWSFVKRQKSETK